MLWWKMIWWTGTEALTMKHEEPLLAKLLDNVMYF